MLIYWLLFAYPVVAALVSARAVSREDSRPGLLALGGFLLFYNILSAVRFEIGGDWANYALMVETISREPLEFALGYGDVAFNFMAWVFTRLGLGLAGINTLCSMILSLGVVVMARRTPAPWLAIAAAVPYLLIVVGLGYIRQAAAIGFVLLAIAAFSERRNVLAACYIVLATLFHVAAVVVLPLMGLALLRRNFAGMLLVGVVGLAIGGYALSEARVQAFQTGYIEAGYDSAGTLVRLVINLVPAILLLLRRKAMRLGELEEPIWTWMAIASVGAMLAFFVSPSSTAVDRLALFFSPIQVFVFGYFLRAVQERGAFAILSRLLLIGYFATIQLVWLVWAAHSEYWVPYRTVFSTAAGLPE